MGQRRVRRDGCSEMRHRYPSARRHPIATRRACDALYMRSIAFFLVFATGCSMGMKMLPSDYDPRTIPRCETNVAYPVGDGLMAVLLAATAGVVLSVEPPTNETAEERMATVIASGGLAFGFGLSSFFGFREDGRCQDAIAQWDKRQIEQDDLVQEKKRERRRAEEGEFPKRRRVQKPVDMVGPRGFFCSTSVTTPAAGLCARQKADCARSRDAASAVVADMVECALVEASWCVQVAAGDDRCFPAEEVCETGRVRLAADGACREVR